MKVFGRVWVFLLVLVGPLAVAAAYTGKVVGVSDGDTLTLLNTAGRWAAFTWEPWM